YLQGEPKLAFDLVFLDPPFNQGLLPTTCALLEERQWLAESSWIYTESETPPSTLQLPGNWRLHREKKAGQVYYALWQRG
ncbi:16S rRNA (guanine(966)-N(2))-methyltransferase RsmD, partial [Pseudomonas frederiksbergensis]|nr:16S rRNA (guanine(966)-N(2))-methyltransferase RsmD [Pseudomonas frederiksbergensis]